MLNEKYNPKKIIACDDSSMLIRKKICENYKKNRDIPPDGIIEQINILNNFLDMISIPNITVEGYEADDILYSLTKYLSKNDSNDIIVASSDKDLHQLLFLHQVKIFDFGNNAILEKDFISDRYGKNIQFAEQLLLYYSLLGDQSDNIPGVNKIGKKTAADAAILAKSFPEFLQKCKNEDINISDKIRSKFLADLQNAEKSYALLQPQPLTDDECKKIINATELWKDENFVKSISFITELELYNIAKKIREITNTHEDIEKKNKNEIEEKDDFELVTTKFKTIIYDDTLYSILLDYIENTPIVAIDTETNGGNPKTESIVLGYSLCFTLSEAWYIPLYQNGERVFTYDQRINLLKIMMSKNTLCIMHNAPYDIYVLERAGIILSKNIFDTLIAAHIFHGTIYKMGLKELSLKFFSEKMLAFEKIMNFNKYPRFDYLPIQEASEYAAADARQTLRLYHLFKEKYKNQQMEMLFEMIEMPLIKILHKMEIMGIPCDRNILYERGNEMRNEMQKIMQKIKELLPKEYENFNPLSGQQSAELIFDFLKLQITKRTTKTKIASTDASALQPLFHAHPIIKLISNYRMLHSLFTRCVTNLKKCIKDDEKIYFTIDQTAVSTGRLATNNPNLQNIPGENSPTKINIRSAFHVNEEDCFVSIDYSQIELRMIAALSGDKTLIDSFKKNFDVHKITASHLFTKNSQDITAEERAIAKRINFSILYGLSAYSLAQDLQISLTDAKKYLETYKTTYSGVFDWIKKARMKAEIEGFVTTILGRVRIIPELLDKNKISKEQALRRAINTIIQGSAAEIVKKAMVEIDNYLSECSPKSYIVLQIHDEILIYTKKDYAEKIFAQATKIMESTCDSIANFFPFFWDGMLKTKGYIDIQWR